MDIFWAGLGVGLAIGIPLFALAIGIVAIERWVK